MRVAVENFTGGVRGQGAACADVPSDCFGIVGVGCGNFLSPLVLLMGWAGARTTAAVSALFILVNSVAGISGHLAAVRSVPTATWIWAGAAAIGGFAGSHVGSRLLERTVILKVLGVVLVIAGVKLIFV